jgi:formylglycine-generating enzyme required for sulfatase activity
VYAIGAMLYHLLSGTEPYAGTGRRLGARAVLAKVLAGAPDPLAARATDTPSELIAICERAMARDPAARYPSMRALEGDLRAFLEKRVVSAYDTGALAELRKWVERNSKLATTVAAAGLAVVSLAGWAMLERGRALDSANDARASAAEARTERDKVLRVSAVKTLGDLQREWGELFPMTPARAAAMMDWITRADKLIAAHSEHEAVLAEIRARGIASEDGAIDFGSDVQSKWWHDTLAELVDGLSAFAGPRVDAPTISSMRTRYAIASRLGESTLLDPEFAWSAAIARIAATPVYGGLVLQPQLGLVPLGPDPDSGFEEFALWVTGDLPIRDASNGKLLLTDTSAAVLVLLPGGETRVGAQSDDPTAPHYEVEVGALEGPVTVVPLDPFFLGKHEITQAQWERVKATRPSSFPGGEPHLGVPITVRHPVETVSYADCRDFARRIGTGVTLPTEAQWEYGCRAGTSTAFFCGADILGLDLYANLCDAHAKEKHGSPAWTYELSLNDGFTVTAPVGSLRPNGFGIHDTHGNVAEWCLDHPLPYYLPARPGDGLREYVHDLGRRPLRGGAFAQTPSGARSAGRALDVIDFRSNVAGFRIAKSIEK